MHLNPYTAIRDEPPSRSDFILINPAIRNCSQGAIDPIVPPTTPPPLSQRPQAVIPESVGVQIRHLSVAAVLGAPLSQVINCVLARDSRMHTSDGARCAASHNERLVRRKDKLKRIPATVPGTRNVIR